ALGTDDVARVEEGVAGGDGEPRREVVADVEAGLGHDREDAAGAPADVGGSGEVPSARIADGRAEVVEVVRIVEVVRDERALDAHGLDHGAETDFHDAGGEPGAPVAAEAG